MSARCRCGAYISAARARAGNIECVGCESDMDANFTRYAPVNAALDAIETASATPASATPTIHLNGTPAASLIEQNRVARVTLRTAIVALQEARPHERDYYPQNEAAFGHAQSEHRSRMERLESVLGELEELGRELARSR